MFYKKAVFKKLKISQNPQENFSVGLPLLIKFQALGLSLDSAYRPEALKKLFSCKFCEIFKDNFFTGHLRVTASYWREFLKVKFLESI